MIDVYVINSFSAIESVSCVQNMAFGSYESAEEYLLKFCNHDKEVDCMEDGILFTVDQFKDKDTEEYYVIKRLSFIK